MANSKIHSSSSLFKPFFLQLLANWGYSFKSFGLDIYALTFKTIQLAYLKGMFTLVKYYGQKCQYKFNVPM